MSIRPLKGKQSLRRSTKERIVLAPNERREAVLQVIRSARRRLILSVFRCDDFKVLDELDEAIRRKVQVEALLTPRAKGWEKKLSDLEAFLVSMGAGVHRFQDPVVKYHAKYVVADDGPALIASLNFTRKCFEKTCDFVLVTHDADVVSGLQKLFQADWQARESFLPDGLSDRLIVSPERARAQFTALLQQARQSIRIIDRRILDPAIVGLLKAQRAKGVAVELLGDASLRGMIPHGRLLLVDEQVAAIGSISLEAEALDFRREVAVVVRHPGCVAELSKFFHGLSPARGGKARPKAKD